MGWEMITFDRVGGWVGGLSLLNEYKVKLSHDIVSNNSIFLKINLNIAFV